MSVQIIGDKSVGDFAKLLFKIGERKTPKDNESEIPLSSEMAHTVHKLGDLIDNVYPDVANVK